MTHLSWIDAVSAIRLVTGPTTERQLKLARMAGVELPSAFPQIVAAARLQEALASDLHIRPSSEPSESQLELIAVMSEFAPKDVEPAPRNVREATAWLRFLYLKMRAHALETSRLESGDVVEFGSREVEVAEISSIGSDGRIYFRGGMGRGAWPDEVTVRAKRNDDTEQATKIRKDGANQRAERAKIARWSVPKDAEVREYAVRSPLYNRRCRVATPCYFDGQERKTDPDNSRVTTTTSDIAPRRRAALLHTSSSLRCGVRLGFHHRLRGLNWCPMVAGRT
jgi:hypothetical protein